jgi:hypothetical protein
MTFVSLAEATRRLGIDAKTFHRWLAEAQIPLHNHPDDGRKKGVSDEHLQVLAHLHQRSLVLLPEEPAVPTALLALPEQIAVLQTQIAALQQQVADLACLLKPHQSASANPTAQAQPSRTAKRPSKSTPAAPRSRPKASAPSKPVHVIPRVEYGKEGHYVVICPKHGLLPFEPDTEEWFAWVREQESFRFVGKEGHFTAYHWWRVPRGAWRAHRQIRNHSYVLRLAPNHELTIAVLEQAAEALQAHLI